jgi:hypothetical protein
MYIPVKDNPGLVRDEHNNAILNTDKAALRRSRARRKVIQEKDNKIELLEQRLELLEKVLKEKLGI